MKPLSGVLLVIGTAVGGGMLALPLATAQAGYWHSIPLFICIWSLMTLSAFYLLEVNLMITDSNHLITMSRRTIGLPGQVIVCFFYLLLLYSALAAYIASGTDLCGQILLHLHVSLPGGLIGLLFTVVMASIIYCGIKQLDWANRGFMLFKIALFMLLLILLLPHTNITLWQGGVVQGNLSSMSVICAAFAFGMIIPSLRDMYKSNIGVLRKVIMYGTTIPLVAYLLWNAAIQGIIPVSGAHGLATFANTGHSMSALTQAVTQRTHKYILGDITQSFSSVCILTSFLGVGLSLVSFFKDGMQKKISALYKISLYLLAFIPPWLAAIFYPQAFMYGIRFAGISAAILLMLAPAIMAYRARYILELAGAYQVFGGKKLLQLHILASSLIIIGICLDWVLS